MNTFFMTNIKLFIAAALLCSFVFAVPQSFSQAPESYERERLHLLNFVIQTECDFERNGKKHSGEDAYKHIQRKYKYAKPYISTTEQFIEYTATKSTVSGKEYLVYCGSEEPITSKQWLLDELQSYRQENTFNG